MPSEEYQELLMRIRAKVRDNIEVEEEELRELILLGREGRRSAAIGQTKRRKAPIPPISVSQLFANNPKAELAAALRATERKDLGHE